MKKILLILLALTSATSAQNYSVLPWGACLDRAGQPYYWPAQVTPIGTNAAVSPPAILMTGAQLLECKTTNWPAYQAWQSNQVYQAEHPREVNREALRALFEAFADYEALCKTNTPTAAQVALEVRRLNGAMLQLRPLLIEIYKGD